MPKLTKIQLLLIFGGIILVALFFFIASPPKEKEKEILPQILPQKEQAMKIFSIDGAIKSIDPPKRLLVLSTLPDKKELQLIVGEDTLLMRSKSTDPLRRGVFLEEDEPVAFENINVGDRIFVGFLEDITGKERIEQIKFIQVLP